MHSSIWKALSVRVWLIEKPSVHIHHIDMPHEGLQVKLLLPKLLQTTPLFEYIKKHQWWHLCCAIYSHHLFTGCPVSRHEYTVFSSTPLILKPRYLKKCPQEMPHTNRRGVHQLLCTRLHPAKYSQRQPPRAKCPKTSVAYLGSALSATDLFVSASSAAEFQQHFRQQNLLGFHG